MSCPDDAKVGRNCVLANLFITFHYTKPIFFVVLSLFYPLSLLRLARQTVV